MIKMTVSIQIASQQILIIVLISVLDIKSVSKRKKGEAPMPKNREIEFEDADEMSFSNNTMTVSKSRYGTTDKMHESSLKSTIGNSIGKISNDDFENIKVIGRGSFGKVYLVKKKDSGEYFAMKILKKDELILKDLLEKTIAERDILQLVDCPYIVRLHYAF
jgi:hypothetical protein